VSLDGKNDQVKKTKKGVIITRFWYTLKKLHPIAQTMDLLKEVKINIKVK
jgi:hypothetical protein